MNAPGKRLALALALCLLGGCVATAPLKVATKTTKLGVKAAATGVKTTAKVVGAAIPDDDDADKK